MRLSDQFDHLTPHIGSVLTDVRESVYGGLILVFKNQDGGVEQVLMRGDSLSTTRCPDPQVMIDALRGHVTSHPESLIESCDDPLTRSIGFRDVETQHIWYVSLVAVKESPMQGQFQSPQDRAAIAADITAGR